MAYSFSFTAGSLASAAALGVVSSTAFAAVPVASASPVVVTGEQSLPSMLEAALRASGEQGLVGFYRARQHRPLWIKDGRAVLAAQSLIGILRTAELDGMQSGPALAARLERELSKAPGGRSTDLAAAELSLSAAWVEYVRTLRRPVNVGMVYAAGAAEPAAPFASEILSDAAAAPALDSHLESVAKLNPVYDRLRAGLAAWQQSNAESKDAAASKVEARLRLNLDRARALPVSGKGRFILVDAATARMFLYEDGEVRDTMRVIVGKPTEQTPMVAGTIRHAVLNPYWNVPPDLVQKRVAAGVLKDGVGHLKAKNYQLLSDWSAKPGLVDPATVDWKAVADGREPLRVRQQPSASNAMGAVKFMFPNDFGIYLHDTPDKSLFAGSGRALSAGCIRLEDAPRLGKWLFGRALKASSSAPEEVVALPTPVSVVVTYLTAEWTGQRFAFSDDVYGRDTSGTRLAAVTSETVEAMRGIRVK